MIIELVGPPSSGKSTLISNLKNENKYKFAFREDFHQNKFLHLVKISNLKIIFTTYLKIFLLKELSIKNKMFYSKHLSKKIVLINSYDSKSELLIPDEGLVGIYLSIFSIYQVSIYKIVKPILNQHNYFCVYVDVDPHALLKRLEDRGFPPGWIKRNIVSNSINENEKFFDIQKKFKLEYLALKDKKEIQINFHEIDNNLDIDSGLKKLLLIISNI